MPQRGSASVCTAGAAAVVVNSESVAMLPLVETATMLLMPSGTLNAASVDVKAVCVVEYVAWGVALDDAVVLGDAPVDRLEVGVSVDVGTGDTVGVVDAVGVGDGGGSGTTTTPK